MYFAAAVLTGGDAGAYTLPPPIDLQPDTLYGGSNPERFLFFAGTDLWHNAGALYGGMLWSPGGLASDGITLKLIYAGGIDGYRAGTTSVLGAHDMVAVLPGWHISRGSFEGTIYGGLDLQYHSTLPFDPDNSLNGGHAGLRIGADLWWQPDRRRMVAASLSASSIGNSYGVRLATGWRISDRFWAGPEIAAAGDRTYRQWRAGAHLTALRWWFGEWALGAGYVRDSDGRSGVYGRLGVLIRR